MFRRQVLSPKLSRYKMLSRKYAFMYLRGLGPSGILGRFYGPKVVINSIPKAGTNLLEAAIANFPLMRRKIVRTQMAWSGVTDGNVGSLRSLRPGQFMAAHFAHFERLEEELLKNQVKTLFLIRDPRDILVSFYKYVTEIDQTHQLHEFFSSLADDHARLNAAIDGYPDLFPPFCDVMQAYLPWAKSSNCHVVRFEELIGKHGGGSVTSQQESIRRIAAFLEIEITDAKLARVCEATYSPNAATFRTGQIGGWRNVFRDDSLEKFNLSCGAIASKYGYK